MIFVMDQDTSGPATEVTVMAEPGTELEAFGLSGFGQAKCRPDDYFSPEAGKLLAMGRAIADFGEKVTALGHERVVSKAEVDRVLGALLGL